MSDIRFILIGIVLVFVGFIILGTLGAEYRFAAIEADEFDTCYRYLEDAAPVRVNCADKVGEQVALFGVVVAFVASGVVLLIRGLRGNWDSKVRPEDMVGPRSSSGGSNEGAGKGEGSSYNDNNVDAFDTRT